MTSFITWELKGLDERIQRLAAIIPQLQSANRDMARKAAQITVKAMKQYAPVGTHYNIEDDGSVTVSKPETLKKSLRFRTYKRGPNNVEVKFYAAEHVQYVINPTKAHWIRAKNAKFLRFYWADAPPKIVEMFGGQIVYFKQVWHPGSKADKFHLRAYQSVEQEVDSLLTQYGAVTVQALEGEQGRFIF